jgi:3-methyladenine DNA glycosylase AlkD
MVQDAESYVGRVIDKLAPHVNEEVAETIQKYMKNQFPFLGMRAPQLQLLTKELVKEVGLPDKPILMPVVQALWDLPEREYQYVGVSLLTSSAADFTEDDISLLEYTITHKPWWDTLDVIAKHPVGTYFTKFPNTFETRVHTWLSSGDMWLQRSAILCQLGWKQRTQEDVLYRAIEACITSKEFFIRKAIGWALREYSKTNPESVKSFVRSHPELSGLSQREALKVVTRSLHR